MKIKIEDLDLSLQTRAGTDAETIDNYAEAMADGAQFPDVTVFTDGTHYWLSDGFHRVMAAKQMGRTAINADVRKGTEDDAVVFGGTANNKQGKRPTRADVRHFLEMVWERREAIFGGTPTGGNLAERCGVSRQKGTTFLNEKLASMPVRPVRPTVKILQLNDNPEPPKPVRPERLIGANGKTYPMPRMPLSHREEGHVVPLDQFGTEIPVRIQEAFDNAHLLTEICTNISRARCAIANGIDQRQMVFAAVRQDALIDLKNAYSWVSSAKPFCVCRLCQGEGCMACHDRGWQTEDEYNRNPSEYKA